MALLDSYIAAIESELMACDKHIEFHKNTIDESVNLLKEIGYSCMPLDYIPGTTDVDEWIRNLYIAHNSIKRLLKRKHSLHEIIRTLEV